MPAHAPRRPASSMVGGAKRKRSAAARELANTPVADPYRGQLHDPYAAIGSATITGREAAQRPSTSWNSGAEQPWPATSGQSWPPTSSWMQPAYLLSPRSAAPAAAKAASTLSIILGAFAALFGFSLIAAVALQNSLGEPDRSFYRGTDATMVVLGLLDFGLAAAGVLGGTTMLSGRLAGRLWLTAFGWIMFGLSWYWIVSGRGTAVIPLVVAVTAAAILLLSYQPTVTRWLGVQQPAQPE